MDLPGYDKLKPHTTAEWHIVNVYKDSDFQKTAKSINSLAGKDKDTAIDSLAVKYFITKKEIIHYLMALRGGYLMLPQPRRVRIIKYAEDIEIRFSSDASKAEVYEVLERFFSKRYSLAKLVGGRISTAKKRKATESPALIYAIFKCIELKEMSFEEVFDKYITDTLEGYTVKSIQFPTLSKLKEYYEHFKPTNPEL